MTISGILFDFDGTLANTTPLILHCFHQTFLIFMERSRLMRNLDDVWSSYASGHAAAEWWG